MAHLENEKETKEESTLCIDRHDFDCPLCFQLLYEPVTAACGHTFCRDCLYQALQIKKHCPICRHHCSLDIIACPSNVLITTLLDKYHHSEYQTRATQTMKVKSLRKSRHPIFISRTVEYPHVRLSLHIFEAKYRVMVNRIMHSDSKFIIAYMQTPQTPHSIGALCVIKNCTSFHDGRSYIEVIGLKRVKLANIELEDNSFGLLSAEISDYLDIDTQANSNYLLSQSMPVDENNSHTTPNNSSSDDSNTENETNVSNSNDAPPDAANLNANTQTKTKLFLLKLLEKLKSSMRMNEPWNFQKPEWLKTSSCTDMEELDETKEATEVAGCQESELMDRLLLSVERFIEQEESSKQAFYQKVGDPPHEDVSQFSLWVAGALPRRLIYSGRTNYQLTQLQLQILVSRNQYQRLKLAHNLAMLCIQCSQNRSKVQFWIIVCIIGLAILYELLNERT